MSVWVGRQGEGCFWHHADLMQRKDASSKNSCSHSQSPNYKHAEGPYNALQLCAGIHTVVSVVSGPGLVWQLELIEAAKLAGVKTFVPSEFGMPLDLVKCVPCCANHGARPYAEGIGT